MLHRQHDLHKARHPGRFQRMANVGLHAPDRNLFPGREMLAHQRGQSAEFCGIADLRAGGVGLDVVESADVVGGGIGTLHGQHLALLTRCPQALPLPIAGHANATDHGADAIAVGHRPRQRLDDQGDIALGRHQAVGLAPKRT